MKSIIILLLLITAMSAEDMWQKGEQIEDKEKALKYYIEISQKFEENENLCAKAYVNMALCYVVLGEKLKAADCYSYANSLVESDKTMKKERQEWISNAAIYYEDLKKWELSAECYLQAAELTETIIFANKYTINAAKAYQKIEYFSQAIDAYNFVIKNATGKLEKEKVSLLLWQCKLEAANTDMREDRFEIAGDIFNSYAQYLLSKEEEEKGIKYLHKALKVYKKATSHGKEANIYMLLASLAGSRGQHDDSFVLLEAMLEAESHNLPSGNNNFVQEAINHFDRLEAYAKKFIKTAAYINQKHIALKRIAEITAQTILLYEDLEKTKNGKKAGEIAFDLARKKLLTLK